MKKITILLAVIILFAASQSYSQMLPVPKVTLHVTGGYGMPTGNFKQDVPTDSRADADYFPYYTKQLINFGADGKLALGTRGNFRVTLGATYNMFSNDVTALLRPAQGQAGVAVNFKPKVNVMSIALGGEWAFAPTQKVNPYVGLGLAANFFSGKFEFGQSVYVKGAQRSGPMDMKSETRIGVILDAGADFRLSRTVGAILGVKYHFINPLGKGADDPSEIGPNEIDLGDMEHTEDGNYFPARTVSSVNVYAGVSFYFGLMK
ncbi:MAG: hypothetical protein JST55_13470 [Bacteroidetes bacterium]|nr:hypothetical protein [Bacteroidota bacterium]